MVRGMEADARRLRRRSQERRFGPRQRTRFAAPEHREEQFFQDMRSKLQKLQGDIFAVPERTICGGEEPEDRTPPAEICSESFRTSKVEDLVRRPLDEAEDGALLVREAREKPDSGSTREHPSI